MCEPTRYAHKRADYWLWFWSDTYKRDEHDVILDEPFILEKFEHDGLLYLKDGDNFLWDPIKMEEIRNKDSLHPIIWNPDEQCLQEYHR